MKLQHPERLKAFQKFLKSKQAFHQLPAVGVGGEKLPKGDLRKEYADERYVVLVGREEDRLGTWETMIFCHTEKEIAAVIEFTPCASLQVYDLEEQIILHEIKEDKRPMSGDLVTK